MTHDEEAGSVGLSFRVRHSNIDRTFNLKRSTEEDLSSVLTRISSNIQKVLNKKKKKNEEPASVVPVDIKTHEGGVSVSRDMSCFECFVAQAKQHYLDIGEQAYNLDVNPPIVQTLELPKNMMAGFSVYPNKIEVANGKVEDSLFTWFKSDIKFSSDEEAKALMGKIKWLEMGTGYMCSTSNDDVGRMLKVRAVRMCCLCYFSQYMSK